MLIGRVQKFVPSEAWKTSVSYPRSTSILLLPGKETSVKWRMINFVLARGVDGTWTFQVLGDAGADPVSGPTTVCVAGLIITPTV